MYRYLGTKQSLALSLRGPLSMKDSHMLSKKYEPITQESFNQMPEEDKNKVRRIAGLVEFFHEAAHMPFFMLLKSAVKTGMDADNPIGVAPNPYAEASSAFISFLSQQLMKAAKGHTARRLHLDDPVTLDACDEAFAKNLEYAIHEYQLSCDRLIAETN